MWKRIWNKAEKRAGSGGLAGSMTMMNEWFFPPSSGRRWREAPEVGSCTLLAEQNQWISPVGTFSEWSWDRAMRQKSMRSLYLLHGTRQGEHLWFSPPWCFLTCPLCRAFPSTYHSFFSSLFFWKAPYRCHAGIDMVLFHMLCMKSMSVLHSIFSLKYEALYLRSSFGYKSCN